LIPSTVGAFIAFLGLVAPGLVFQMTRESRRPTYGETAFRELSRIALTSLIFTLASLVLLACLRLAWPGQFIDARAWVTHGQVYLASHLLVVSFTLVLEVALACLLAFAAAEALSRRSRARISPFGIWYKVLRDECPDGTRPWITVHLTDGTELTGLLRHYTESQILENQELAIGGPHMSRLSPDGIVSSIGKNFDAAVVRGDQILYMVVRYQNQNGELVRRRVKGPPKKKRAEKAVNEVHEALVEPNLPETALGAASPVNTIIDAIGNDVERTQSALSVLTRYFPSVWSIGDEAQGPRATAFVVGEANWMATTARTLATTRRGDSIELRASKDDKSLVATVVFRDDTTDVSILRSDEDAGPPLALSTNTTYYLGDKEGAIMEINGDGTVNSGVLMSLGRVLDDLGDRGELGAQLPKTAQGNSGAPVLNAGGEVLGMVTGRTSEEMNILLISSARIAWALECAKQGP
jgi:S1-C subfamily serine protease